MKKHKNDLEEWLAENPMNEDEYKELSKQ